MGQKIKLNKYLNIFSYLVVAMFFILGVFIIFSDYYSNLPKNYRIIFAILIISYGMFRLITIINKNKEIDNHEDE
jgi:ABC-type multidrug transport system permease subunit